MKKILIIVILLAACSNSANSTDTALSQDVSNSDVAQMQDTASGSKDVGTDPDVVEDAQTGLDQNHADADVGFITKSSKFQAAYDEEWERSEAYYMSELVADNGVDGTQLRYYDMRAINGPIAMFQVTGEQKYLDHLFSYLDKQRALATLAPGAYFGDDPYYDWLTNQPENAEVVLFETHGQRDALKGLAILKRYPTLREWNHPELGSYQKLYESYVEWYAVHLWEKWYTRGRNNLYRGRTWMTSHLAQIALYLEYVDTDATRLDQYRDFLNAHDGLNGMTWADWLDKHGGNDRGGQSFRAQIRDEDGHAVWSGSWGNLSGYGDFSHTNAGVQYVVNNHVFRGDYSLDIITKMIKTLNRGLDSSPDEDFDDIPNLIDGVYDSADDNRDFIHHGWAMLGRYDANLQSRLERLNTKQALSSRYLNIYLGNLAYNQAYLDGELVYPEF